MSDTEIQSPAKKVRKPNKKGVENKREKALANLALARAKRLEMAQAKKQSTKHEYVIESDTESDSGDELILQKQPKKIEKSKSVQKEMDDMKEVLKSLVEMQKQKPIKQKKKEKTIVVNVQHEPKKVPVNDAWKERMKGIFG